MLSSTGFVIRVFCLLSMLCVFQRIEASPNYATSAAAREACCGGGGCIFSSYYYNGACEYNCNGVTGSCSWNPTNGGWSQYYATTTCSASCGGGTQIGTRYCDSPKPRDGGMDCVGESSRTFNCNVFACPVDGGWSKYTFGACTKSCGGGIRVGTRTCTQPVPTNGGKQCDGVSETTEICNDAACPTELSSSPILIEAYTDGSCMEEHVSYIFEGPCQSIILSDGTVAAYAEASCIEGTPDVTLCTDSSCTVCNPRSTLESGDCTWGIGLVSSIKGTCQAKDSMNNSSDPVLVEDSFDPVLVEGYSQLDCAGGPVFSEIFDGSCQSVTSGENTTHGMASCVQGALKVALCDDAGCKNCQDQETVGSGQCGHGFGLFASATGTCQVMEKDYESEEEARAACCASGNCSFSSTIINGGVCRYSCNGSNGSCGGSPDDDLLLSSSGVEGSSAVHGLFNLYATLGLSMILLFVAP